MITEAPTEEAASANAEGLLYRCRDGHLWRQAQLGRSYHPCPVMVEGHVCDEYSRRIDDENSVAGQYANISIPLGWHVAWTDIHGDETPATLGRKGIEKYNPSQIHTNQSGQGNAREVRTLKTKRGLE